MEDRKEAKGKGSAVGSAIATVVLAAVCVAGGWIAKDMWPKKASSAYFAPQTTGIKCMHVRPRLPSNRHMA